MSKPVAITKNTLPYKSMDYHALRKEGIALIEKHSGHVWTDFNKHDPGVTILEALCYVLTELAYKANFPIEDILCSAPDKTGFILQENAFYTASEILPCQPVTTIDFRKLLIDRIEAVNNAWVFSAGEEQAAHLLEVWLLLDEDTTASEEEVIEEARQVLAAHRNLCEDTGKISILPREECQLEAAIFIENKIDPEKTAARIIFELEKTLLNPTLKRYSVEQLLEKDLPLEVIFDGPEMRHGYFSNHTLTAFPRDLDLLKVMNTILNIDGVYHISDLSVTFKGKRYTDHISLDQCLPVFLPRFSTEAGHKLSFYKNETILPFKEEESFQIYEQLKSQQQRNYAIDTAMPREINYKEGRFRNISHYLSLQHEFPHLYGIGRYGLPPDSSKERKAQAKQLKGFLLHFEQILANSFAQLAHLKKLFSIYPVTQTYFHQPLTTVPDIKPLITENTGTSEKEAIGAHYRKWKDQVEDDYTFLSRRNDFLNHLLARFNVAFNESIYYDFGYFPETGTVLKRLIKAKEYYLQHLVSLLRNRGRGINYLLEKQETPLSLKRQLELFLDIAPHDKRLSPVVQDVVFYLPAMEEPEEEEDSYGQDEHLFSKGAVLADFLSSGIAKERYRISPSGEEPEYYTLLLDLKNENFTIDMGTVDHVNDAIEEIEKLRRKILQFSMESEGVYVVEHLLLYPGETQGQTEKDPFYDYRMSLIFPSWPARFQEKGFREQARLLVSDIVPAHIRTDCFWIALEDMRDFEDLYALWIKECRKDPHSERAVQHAMALRKLLENYHDNYL